MLNRLLDLFKSDASPDEPINTSLAAAALMFEVVWADHDIDEAELSTMRELLEQQFQLDSVSLDNIIKQTRANHDASVGVFPFTRVLNEQLDQEKKYAVVEAMWRIALADQKIDSFEEHTIRRISDLLYISHQRFIEAKLSAKAAGSN